MKKIYTLVLIALTFCTQAQLTLDSGLVACYSLNGHGADAISGLHGTAYGLNPATNRLNVPNACLSFSCNPQAFLELPNSPLLKSQQLSFSAWIKPLASFYSKGYVLYTAYSGITAPGYALTLESTSNGWAMKLRRQTPGGLATIQSTAAINLNNWVHVGFTLDNLQMRLYINGVSQGSVAATGAVQYTTGAKVYLGATNEPNHAEPFCGSMDNVRFYNRNLSAQEFLTLKNTDPACVTATAAPVANFTVSPPACVNQPMQFTNLSTNNPDAYSWQIANAVLSNSLQSNPVVTFTAAGTFSAVLSVSNALGSSSVLTNFTIYPKPIVKISPTNTLVCRDSYKTFSGTGASSYTWQPMQTYSNTINYLIKTNTKIILIGLDSLGCTNVDSLKLRIVICEFWGVEEEGLDQTIDAGFDQQTGKLWYSSKAPLNATMRLFGSDLALISENKYWNGEHRVLNHELALGLYYLVIEDQGRRITKKIVVY